jgi:Spy/CpxP family protein refolding chaperone
MSKTLATAFLLTVLGSFASIVNAAQPSPYAGQEKREIKALSSEEVATYLEGKGMGLAKSAELNHYPGPAHVLALATELGLTPDQRARAEMLFKTMEAEAVTLGKQLIEREQELDDMFASKTITNDKLQQSLEAIASMQGRIRQVHLQTHLVQAEILDAEQIRKYDELRGYTQTANSTHHGHPQQH